MCLTRLVDYWGCDVAELKNKKLFLFDMDGTIYREDNLFNGTLEMLDTIINNDGRYIFITNNSSKSVAEYVDKLNHLGIRADEDDFFTSAQATSQYLKENFPKAKIYCQGTKSLINELRRSGIIVTEREEEDVKVVLVGFDTEMTSDKLATTCKLLNREIPFIATNPDLRCPMSFGFVPDCGSICQMIKNATEKSPIYMGKPEPIMVDIVRRKYGYTTQETVIIGDRLYTDIAVGVHAGVTSICVLTGETNVQDIRESEIKPTFTFYSVFELGEILRKI